MSRIYRKNIDEPNMSDRTILVSVEDLICTAFGPNNKNTVNFKLVQTILHILARQLRLLEQDVEIKFDEIKVLQQADDVKEYDGYDSSSSSSEDVVARGAARREQAREKKERDKKEGKGEKKKRVQKERKEEEKERGGKEGKPDKKERGEKEGKGKKKEKGEQEGKGENKEQEEKEGKGEIEDRGEKQGKVEINERDKKVGKGELKEREEKESKGEKKKRAEKEGKGDKKERVEKGGLEGKHDPDGKRDQEEKSKREGKRQEDKGERGGKREQMKKEDEGRGKTSSKDRDGKEESADRDGKSKEDRKRKDRESPSIRHRDRKGDDDREEGEDHWGGREGGGKHDARKDSLGRSVRRQESGTSITVTEATRKEGKGGKDKILVAERGPASRTHPTRVGSIEVVTASQFALLEQAVKQLEQVSSPPPAPALPDNVQLRKDLAKGRASLSDTMQAVQLNARVQAAEQGLSRMAELLTQLAMAGALPMDLANSIGQMQAELKQGTAGAGPPDVPTARFADEEHGGGAGTARGAGAGRHGTGRADQGQGRSTKSLADPSSIIGTKQSASVAPSSPAWAAGQAGSVEAPGAPGPAEPQPRPVGVTHQEMHDFLENIKETITKEILARTARANHSADMAANTSRSVADKLDAALRIDGRITTLLSQTQDYAEQLSGFDSGLTTQMSSFQEQMAQIRSELKGGLILLESANNNAETAAILDLSERYEGLVMELENTVHLYHELVALQKQLSDELRSLVECVEMLREQKADRDEVLDGLRDKADISRLAGLLYQKDFAQARYEIETRLAKCYEKFHKQDQVWQTAVNDLSLASDKKAEIINLMALKEEATMELNKIQEKLRKLEIMLGEPKAALLMRRLALGAACGACLSRAMMPPADVTYGMPARLPALRPQPADDDCLVEVKLTPPDEREHVCRRWVGGSHTLMGGHVVRQKADQVDLQAAPTKKFDGYGIDGKLYLMEEDLQPCAECNKLTSDETGHVPTPTGAGGDQPWVTPTTEERGDDQGNDKSAVH